jgi:hypothetical protein
MTTTITDCYNVGEKLHDLGCLEPRGLVLLPENLESVSGIGELRQAAETATLRKLLKQSGVAPDEIIDGPHKPPTIHNKWAEWMPPTIFLAASIWTDNPQAVTVALGIIANYATDLFKGLSGEKRVKLQIIVERSKDQSCKKVSYEGSPEGMKEIADILRQAADD